MEEASASDKKNGGLLKLCLSDKPKYNNALEFATFGHPIYTQPNGTI
jgi:hypothetical protein